MHIGLGGYIDKALALLQLVVAGVSMIFPTYNSWIGGITVFLTLLVGCFFVCHFWKIRGVFLYLTPISAFILGCATWYFFGQPTRAMQQSCVGQDAQSTVVTSIEHEAYSIGKPIDCVKVAAPVPNADQHSAYFGEFDKAAIIWIYEFGSFYILNVDGSWRQQNELGYCDGRKYKWCNDEKSGRTHFSEIIGPIPKDKHPYRSGIARMVDSDHNIAQQIGWMEWDCEMKSGSVFYEKTNSGIIIGPFPSAYDELLGQIFIIKNDKTFTKVNAKMESLPCIQNMGYH